jgi:hypothetical protein
MTPAAFRRLALRLAGAVESAHQEHPDFRRRGKVFASLGYPDADHGMVRLTTAQQAACIAAAPDVFAPAAGAWGRGGCTLVRLAAAEPALVRRALTDAFDRLAPTTYPRGRRP